MDSNDPQAAEHVGGEAGPSDADWMDIDDDYEVPLIPLGDEGTILSHEGGEYELCKELFADTGSVKYVFFVMPLIRPLKRLRKRVDARTRHDRTERRNVQWAEQLNDLVDAYLAWQADLEEEQAAQDGDAANGSLEIATVDFFGTQCDISVIDRSS